MGREEMADGHETKTGESMRKSGDASRRCRNADDIREPHDGGAMRGRLGERENYRDSGRVCM
ncbi:uncharacterized protein BCN122_II0272 [Burkholderia cenocepacia]|nr:uncharacterized protein BCN122_II0272 [Burkholderia cenocepacia]